MTYIQDEFIVSTPKICTVHASPLRKKTGSHLNQKPGLSCKKSWTVMDIRSFIFEGPKNNNHILRRRNKHRPTSPTLFPLHHHSTNSPVQFFLDRTMLDLLLFLRKCLQVFWHSITTCRSITWVPGSRVPPHLNHTYVTRESS